MNSIIIKTFFLFCILTGAGFQKIYSQFYSQSDNLLKLPALTNISSVPWKDSIYRFPAFEKGKITYATGSLEHEFYLNYNMYFEKMDFISESGDTLNITNTREIKEIQIGHTWFFHDHKTGYYEVILKLPVALAVKNQFVFQNSKVRGAVRGFADVRGAAADYDRYYEILPTYFFIDKNNSVHRATRASILKLSPDHRAEVSAYLQKHSPDFESREDLVQLLTYCNQFISF
jgi:hypothetical protein